VEKYDFLKNWIKNMELFRETIAIKNLNILSSEAIKEEKNIVTDTCSEIQEKKIEEVPTQVTTHYFENYFEKREALKNRKITPDDLVQFPYEDHTYALTISRLSNLNESGQLLVNYQDEDTDDADEPFFKRNLFNITKILAIKLMFTIVKYSPFPKTLFLTKPF
jgi:hypothetical protein